MTSANSVDPVEMPQHAASSSGSAQFAIVKAIFSYLDHLEISTLKLKDHSKSFYTFIIEGLILIGINWLIQNNFKVGAAVVYGLTACLVNQGSQVRFPASSV